MRQRLTALCIDQQQGVLVQAKGRWPNIAHQERHAFALTFGGGVFEQIMALRRKTHAIQSAALGAGLIETLQPRCLGSLQT